MQQKQQQQLSSSSLSSKPAINLKFGDIIYLKYYDENGNKGIISGRQLLLLPSSFAETLPPYVSFLQKATELRATSWTACLRNWPWAMLTETAATRILTQLARMKRTSSRGRNTWTRLHRRCDNTLRRSSPSSSAVLSSSLGSVSSESSTRRSTSIRRRSRKRRCSDRRKKSLSHLKQSKRSGRTTSTMRDSQEPMSLMGKSSNSCISTAIAPSHYIRRFSLNRTAAGR